MSTLEDALLFQLKAVGLLLPEREYRFSPPRKWRFDFAWPHHKLAVEVEGGVWVSGRHTRGSGFEADCEKYNAAALAGWRVLRVTNRIIRSGHALALLERALTVREQAPSCNAAVQLGASS